MSGFITPEQIKRADLLIGRRAERMSRSSALVGAKGISISVDLPGGAFMLLTSHEHPTLMTYLRKLTDDELAAIERELRDLGVELDGAAP